jgi:hypothetical protein
MISMDTLEKPTVQATPANLAEINPALTQGNIVETAPVAPTEAVLGEVATREEYRFDNNREPVLESPQLNNDAELATAAIVDKSDDDKVEDPLSGFTVHDATEVSENVDELPEDLRSELGEPDDDEVNAA